MSLELKELKEIESPKIFPGKLEIFWKLYFGNILEIFQRPRKIGKKNKNINTLPLLLLKVGTLIPMRRVLWLCQLPGSYGSVPPLCGLGGVKSRFIEFIAPTPRALALYASMTQSRWCLSPFRVIDRRARGYKSYCLCRRTILQIDHDAGGGLYLRWVICSAGRLLQLDCIAVRPHCGWTKCWPLSSTVQACTAGGLYFR